jgi:hypothetical protein
VEPLKTTSQHVAAARRTGRGREGRDRKKRDRKSAHEHARREDRERDWERDREYQ